MKKIETTVRPSDERPSPISIRPLDKKETAGMPSNGNGA